MAMDKIVLDTNVVVKWFSDSHEELVPQARHIYDAIADGKLIAIAPNLLLTETLNILVVKKHFPSSEAQEALQILLNSGIEFIDLWQEDLFLSLELMHQFSVTAYDAQYLSLAKSHQCLLLTEDKSLLKATNMTVSLRKFFTK